MDKQTAVNKLKANRTISTDMIPALDITFEQWLRVAQYNEKSFQICIDRLIAREEKKLNTPQPTK
jgi:hypothetical protein